MSVITHDSARLRRLRSLRLEIDQAIADEVARLERQTRLSRPVRADLVREKALAAILARLDTATVRSWARSEGLPVADRGPLSVELFRACAEARYQQRSSHG